MSSTNSTGMPENFRMALLVLYIVILLAGALNILLMSCMLQSQRRLSYTKVSVINLIAVHGIFLLTVPFRIYYYTLNTWTLGIFFCKIVSLMIHFHMYVGFIFYVFLLIVRFLENCDSQQRLGFQHLLHALIASAAVWLVIFASVFPPTLAYYGTSQNDSTQCFHFSKEIDNAAVKILNCVICSLVVLLWSFLSMLQLYFLHRVRKTFGRTAWNRQEFWAQCLDWDVDGPAGKRRRRRREKAVAASSVVSVATRLLPPSWFYLGHPADSIPPSARLASVFDARRRE
ncbi:hypothetical protein DNTS_013322 [Danionella cerebrum]|uniref:G-protein coupled receptors family 1 profile domain-containing protein n=1 Tax=Danionella cerebrum TaxID=2873325 RepID=A0A553QQV3_9TELE|nr:hypothetical protein DNTS_013322 [Danionella translucida]